MAKFDQQDQDITGSQFNAGEDIVFRDKIIHNIVVVGQFLDFAQIEGLIPPPPNLKDFEEISTKFEKTFTDRLGSDLINGVTLAGEILGKILPSWKPKSPLQAIPFRTLIPKLAPHIASKLTALYYWETFNKKEIYIESQFWEVVYLYSLSELWKKQKQYDALFGIAQKGTDESKEICFVRTLKTTSYDSEKTEILTFDNFDNQQFRIFITGIVIDLIRMGSVVSTDVQFWSSVVGLIASRQKAG